MAQTRCGSRRETAWAQEQEYYGEAGMLTFLRPARMADAGLYFTSLVAGSVAPVVISFSPTQGGHLAFRRLFC